MSRKRKRRNISAESRDDEDQKMGSEENDRYKKDS
jgi:hypothetical protein